MKVTRPQKGQAILEYALLAVFVGLILVVILQVAWPGIKNLFFQTMQEVKSPYGNVDRTTSDCVIGTQSCQLLSAVCFRTGYDNGNSVQCHIAVRSYANVTVVDHQGGFTKTHACSSTCIITMPSVGFNADYVTITSDGGDSLKVNYPDKNHPN